MAVFLSGSRSRAETQTQLAGTKMPQTHGHSSEGAPQAPCDKPCLTVSWEVRGISLSRPRVPTTGLSRLSCHAVSNHYQPPQNRTSSEPNYLP